MTEKIHKTKKTFTMRPEIFLKLKVYSVRHAIPYGIVIETLVDTFLTNPENFTSVNFDKYK